jgi:hypothetical protein
MKRDLLNTSLMEAIFVRYFQFHQIVRVQGVFLAEVKEEVSIVYQELSDLSDTKGF